MSDHDDIATVAALIDRDLKIRDLTDEVAQLKYNNEYGAHVEHELRVENERLRDAVRWAEDEFRMSGKTHSRWKMAAALREEE